MKDLYETRRVEIADIETYYRSLEGLWSADDVIDEYTGEVVCELNDPISASSLARIKRARVSEISIYDIESLDVGEEAVRELQQPLSGWTLPYQIAGELLGRHIGSEELALAWEVARVFVDDLPVDDPPETWLRRPPRLQRIPPSPRASRHLLPVLARRIQSYRDGFLYHAEAFAEKQLRGSS